MKIAVNRSRTGRLRVCVAGTAIATASERAGVHYLLVIRRMLFYFQAVLEPRVLSVFTIPFCYRSVPFSFPFPFRLNGTEQDGNYKIRASRQFIQVQNLKVITTKNQF